MDPLLQISLLLLRSINLCLFLARCCVAMREFDHAQVAGQILELAGARRFRANIVLEGGSIHVDGEGCAAVLLTCSGH